MTQPDRIYLSPPDVSGAEQDYVKEAFASNWIAPVGPHLQVFEEAMAQYTGVPHAVALSSGTAAIHLALILSGVGPGDTVVCPTLTFVATANPIRYCGAEPVFIDSEEKSWNLDPALLREYLDRANRENRLPRAVIAVDLYGQCADLPAIQDACRRYNIPLIEDAAEALGAFHGKRSAGAFGDFGVFSFNGNKIITTSGGGMLMSHDGGMIQKARKLATQAREPAVHYQHAELGYNYRLSNVLAGIGRGQLDQLDAKVQKRRALFDNYREALRDLPLSWMPEADYGPGTRSTRWLSCLLLDPETPLNPWAICEKMNGRNIECRPLWKPLHLQPLYAGCSVAGGSVAEDCFRRGLCLPSGSGMTPDHQGRVIEALRTFLTGERVIK